MQNISGNGQVGKSSKEYLHITRLAYFWKKLSRTKIFLKRLSKRVYHRNAEFFLEEP